MNSATITQHSLVGILNHAVVKALASRGLNMFPVNTDRETVATGIEIDWENPYRYRVIAALEEHFPHAIVGTYDEYVKVSW
jgi:hypothetical protein